MQCERISDVVVKQRNNAANVVVQIALQKSWVATRSITPLDTLWSRCRRFPATHPYFLALPTRPVITAIRVSDRAEGADSKDRGTVVRRRDPHVGVLLASVGVSGRSRPLISHRTTFVAQQLHHPWT